MDIDQNNIVADTKYSLGFCGLSYEQASRRALAMIRSAGETGYWHQLPEQLIELRKIMQTEEPLLHQRKSFSVRAVPKLTVQESMLHELQEIRKLLSRHNA